MKPLAEYVDIHTHDPRHDPRRILSIDLGTPDAEARLDASAGRPVSVGYHPWHIPEDFDAAAMRSRLLDACRRDNVVAIGETGLDRLQGPPEATQKAALAVHAAVARELDLPLILHCVKSIEPLIDVLRSHDGVKIFHGFRQKPQTARQLLNAGYALSFGPRFNAEAVAVVPPDRRYVETDDSALLPEEVARLIAQSTPLDGDRPSR